MKDRSDPPCLGQPLGPGNQSEGVNTDLVDMAHDVFVLIGEDGTEDWFCQVEARYTNDFKRRIHQ